MTAYAVVLFIPALKDGVFRTLGKKYLGNPSAPDCAPPASINISGACRFDYQAAADFFPESDKTNLISRASFAVNSDHTVFAELTASRNHANYRLSPTGINGNQGTKASAWTYPANGPFYPKTYVNSAGQTVATDGNPFNVRIRLTPGGARTNGQESLQTRFLLGAEGVLGGWDYNTAFARSVSQNTQTLTNGYYDRNLLLAAFKTGKINPFGAQTAEGMALMDAAERNIDGRKGKSVTDTFDFRLSKEIMQTDAGAIGMASGLERRREHLEDNSSDEILAGTIFSTSKSRRVDESRQLTSSPA